MIEYLNRLIHGDCIEEMKKLPDECIPLTVTSPPFDDMRVFGGHPFDFDGIARELFRITMTGGVVAWHVREQCKNGKESGTSSDQRLFFRDLGFDLYHTMVITTTNGQTASYRYGRSLDWLFVLSKGKPRTFNPIRDVPNKYAGQQRGFSMRDKHGRLHYQRDIVTPAFRARGPVWTYTTGHNNNTKDVSPTEHPALMHEKLARDIIISWSNLGDVVFDPMAGAATTLKMAMLEGRHYLGFEIHRPYCELGWRRLEKHRPRPMAG